MARMVTNLFEEEMVLTKKPSTVESILGTVTVAAETASKFKTIADKFIYDWGLSPTRRTDAAVSPGYPPAPAIYDYPSQWSKESLDRSIKDIGLTAETLGQQVKGLFNVWYEPTDGQTAAPMTTGFGAIPPIAILAVLGLLIWMGVRA